MDLYKIREALNLGIPLTQMHLKVTDYSRVSTDHLEQLKSLKNQKEHFSEMIKNNPNWIYIDGYIDEGISGTTDYKRNNFMRMIEDARNGKFDLIITKEISRFSRNTLDSIKYTRELLSYGVAVLFINDNINTALPDSELRLTIMSSIAQDEIRRLSERVKFGMKRAIKNGTILGNNTLYGYQKDKSTGNLIIVKNEADTIKKLFSLYVIENYSISKIAKLFNSEHIQTKAKKKWSISTLSRMIKNPKYKGYYCGNKTEVIDYMTKKVKPIPKENWIQYKDKIRIPPIIDEHLWCLANQRLKSRSKPFGLAYKGDKIVRRKYPLSTKIYCGLHNEIFQRRHQCKSTNDITWVCTKHLKKGKKACPIPNVRESEIYMIIDDLISILKIESSAILNILFKIYKKKLNTKIQIDHEKLIELLLNKIIVNKNNGYIELNIFLNISKYFLNQDNHKDIILEKDYSFKRGYNTTCTKRYIVNYHVIFFTTSK